jgi:hypothetical protein
MKTGFVIVKKTRIYKGGTGETGVIYPTAEAALPDLIEWTKIMVNWHRGFETVPYKAKEI